MIATAGIGHTIIAFSKTHPYLVYGLIVFLGIVEGPILSILLGVLIRLGYFDFVLPYIALMVGDLIGDTTWYTIGYYKGRTVILAIGKWFGLKESHVEKVEEKFKRHHENILFFSKLSNGLGLSFAVILTAGITKVPFWKFISISFLGQLLWTALLLGVGYFFGSIYASVSSTLGKITVIAIGVALLVILIAYLRYQRER